MNQRQQAAVWLKTPQHPSKGKTKKINVSATFCSALYVLHKHKKKQRWRADFFYRYRSRMQTGSFRGHLVEGSWYPAAAPCGLAHQKLIWRRLLWHRCALICCQCDEDAEPNTPPHSHLLPQPTPTTTTPSSNTEPLIRETFSLPDLLPPHLHHHLCTLERSQGSPVFIYGQ